MVRYILKRILLMIPVVLGVTAVIFLLLSLVPGDPARLILGNEATAEMVELKREELGLNDPLIIRLLTYLKNVFIYQDFGTSYYNTNPIISAIIVRLPRTMTIAAGGILITVLIGIPLGVLSAVYQNSLIDRICMVLSMVGVAVPEFCLALIFINIFSTKLGWLPSHGINYWYCYILPILSTGIASVAGLTRNARNSTLEAIRSDYVTTARSKGVKESKVITHHVLPNSMIPVVSSIGSSFANMMGGAIIIENVFSIPGMGQYLVTAIGSRDYNVVTGCVVVIAIIFSLIMLLVDLVFAMIDPRIKAQYVRADKKRRTA